jgi:hypothetical protein
MQHRKMIHRDTTMRATRARSIDSNKKDLSSEQREELLRAMKARFEKNMNRHKVLNGLKYKQGWKLMLKNCGHSLKWKELAVNRTLLVMIKRRANTFFMIVQRKS